VFLLAAFAAGCRGPGNRHEYEFNGHAMGTSFSVKVVSGPLAEEERARLRRGIEAELDAVNQRMSTYLETSELTQLNRHAGVDPLPVSAELLTVLVAARAAGTVTRGAFDITVAPLVNAWGFGPDGRPPSAPTPADLARLGELTGWNRIEIDDRTSTVRKAAPGVICDLSGVAKGYAVDRVADWLGEAGYANHLVEVGGEIRAGGGNRSGRPWRIAVERPLAGAREVQRIVPLRDLAMATSGDYRNYYEQDGVRYSHIIDPRSRRSIRHRLASVSVIERFCMAADALATGLLVLGDEEGYTVAMESDLAVLFLVRRPDGSFVEKATPKFESLFGAAGGESKGGEP
jgi:thiamine biosynthesis lipoprotein